MVKETRGDQLLRLATEAMKDGQDPFHESFLNENNVSLNEVYYMAEQMAQIIQGYLKSPKDVQACILLSGIVEPPTTGIGPKEIWGGYVLKHQGDEMRELRKKIEQIKL